MNTVFYNVQHAPIGAYASFTLGQKGAAGGFGLRLGRPANQSVYIGLEDTEGDGYQCLPFFAGPETASGPTLLRVKPFADAAITRELTPSRDIWRAGEMEFQIHSPVCSAPEPGPKNLREQKLAYLPAVTAELTLDNRRGERPRRFIFGFENTDETRPMRRLEDDPDTPRPGIGVGDRLALVSGDTGVVSALGASADAVLEEKYLYNYGFGLGSVGLLLGTVPAGKRRTFRFAICFHRDGTATTGLKGAYYYTRLFPDIESVAAYALDRFAAVSTRGKAFDRKWAKSGLCASRRWLLAQAVHSYYANTALFEIAGKPQWVVYSGEDRLMNALDITADLAPFELALNPWSVPNVLDAYARRSSYQDKICFPGQVEEKRGGLAFAHDMGVAGHFAKPGHSAYEKTGLTGRFSHMSHEGLVNWLSTGLLVAQQPKQRAWARKRRKLFAQGLESLLRRDHPEAAKRDGVMSLDSGRCGAGSEITAYDTLDPALAQARRNLYLAVRCWGLYIGLAAYFERQKDKRRARTAAEQARRAATTIAAAASPEGVLPALIGEHAAGQILPAVEGLLLPWQLGLRKALRADGPNGEFIGVLQRHLIQVLKPGVCLGPDGGWKLSSASEVTWLSKIARCQFVAESVLGLDQPELMRRADEAHAAWLRRPANAAWGWSDQLAQGEATSGRHSPRGVAAYLWLA